ncbi:pyridoxal phosphate-dependent class II aminotransferase [Bengtsoniella intestinalis]|uniref:pyridoxal phosphate-dependent aminotransferase n=1 Tax=Bengtsoniella intestinalis TaxID=3073143 RepID=UPI00391FBEA2
MIAYTHGGDIWNKAPGLADFSANLNPLGMPPAVALAAAEGAKQATCYPDPLCRDLSAKIATVDGVAPQWVLCGNGAADLIFRLAVALQPKKALVTAPTFSEYAQSLSIVGCETTHHLLLPEENFTVTDRILDALDRALDILFLCSPNNPTGQLVDEKLMLAILEKSAQFNIQVVVDECFLGLSTGGVGLAPYLSQYPNLFLLRAFTKSYAMAGLRLGYGLSSSQELLDKVAQCGQPWSVSTPAQLAGLAALDCPDWVVQARALLAQERPRLVHALQSLGLTVYGGQANYILFQAKGCCDLKERLLEKQVLIRACNNYQGLGGDYYRICIKSQEENQRLITALQEVL